MLVGWTYDMCLEYLKNNSMAIGRITTISGSNNTGDLENPYTIEWYDIEGNREVTTVFPEFNLNNRKLNQIDTYIKFNLWLTTKITIPVITKKSVLTFKFYPKEISSSLFALGAKPEKQTIVQTSGYTIFKQKIINLVN